MVNLFKVEATDLSACRGIGYSYFSLLNSS